ncbi:unknown [Bacteroides uniformis CAG:3]|nr:unknown [Bacteroides uniformis CAG:3]
MYHYLAKLPLYHNKTMPFLLLHHHPYNNLPQFLSTNPTANYPDSFYHVLVSAAMHSLPAASHEAPPDEEFVPTAAMHCQDIHPYTSLPYQKHWIRSSLRKNLTVRKRTKAQDIAVFSYEHVLYQIIITYTQNPFGDKYSHQPTAILFPHQSQCHLSAH